MVNCFHIKKHTYCVLKLISTHISIQLTLSYLIYIIASNKKYSYGSLHSSTLSLYSFLGVPFELFTGHESGKYQDFDYSMNLFT